MVQRLNATNVTLISNDLLAGLGINRLCNQEPPTDWGNRDTGGPKFDDSVWSVVIEYIPRRLAVH
jgi:hypothetical protein